MKVQDTSTSEQAEGVADDLMVRAERHFNAGQYTEAHQSRDEAIYTMLRAVLLELRRR